MRASVLCLLVACGDNAVLPDAVSIDAPIDAPKPPPGCDFGELADITNHTTPEKTGTIFNGSLVLCGQIDPGHAVPMSIVDSDVFDFFVANSTTVLRAELTGPGLEKLSRVELSLVNRFGDPLVTSVFTGAHAVVATHMPIGFDGIAIRAYGDEPAAAMPYVVRFAISPPCSSESAPVYTESASANDVIEVRYLEEPRRAFTAAADAPEATGITVGPQQLFVLGGTSANVDAPDDFRDRDTFEFATGETDVMSVSLEWVGGGTDLDMFVFPANGIAELTGATHISVSGTEAAKLAVLPNTTYWLWIGSYDTSNDLPQDYTATLCGF